MVEAEIDWQHYRSLVPKGVEPDRGTPEWRMREDIILTYLPITKSVVSKMIRTMPPYVERDDLESWAEFGLMQAVLRFDETMNVPFAAFARQRMRSCILDGIREQDWVPRSLRKKQRDIKKVEETLGQELGRQPSEDEVADHLDIDSREVSYTKYRGAIATHVYLDAYSDGGVFYDTLSDPSTVLEASDLAAELRAAVSESFLALPTREAVVIALYYYEKMKLSEIAKLIGVSDVKCGQIHESAVMAIWQDLESYLSA